MFSAVLNDLIHDLEEGIAVFQPSFDLTRVIQTGLRRRELCQALKCDLRKMNEKWKSGRME